MRLSVCSREEFREVVSRGEIIERYPDDVPYPAYLILGFAGGRPIHVVAAMDEVEKRAIVVTVYEPDLMKWEDDYKRRKNI